ncbi:MAG: SPOR domain-containing protein [Roseibium sp.]
MSEDYDTKRSDLTGTPKDTGGDRPAVEDPLIELARIVHKNKPSGADVSSGRVGSTDYFAELDDFAGTSATTEQSSEQAADDSRVEPVFGQQDPAIDQHFEADHPIQSETPESQAFYRPIEPPQPAAPLEPDHFSATRAGAVDLDKEFSAGLEDELIGALRVSVDTPPTQKHDPQIGNIDSTPAPEPFVAAPTPTLDSGYDLHSEGTETSSVLGNSPRQDRPVFGSLESVDISRGAEDEGFTPSLSASPVVASGSDSFESSVGLDRSNERPRIDEDDLFAALNSSSGAGTLSESDTNASSGSAGMDAIFADLDFPDPVERRQTPEADKFEELSAPKPGSELSSSDDIDDMSWPAAASAVPDAPEDETPPPPEGYDLDAVARAMQESDPSLKGSGVLPPHPAAEKAAAPMGLERSRRGIFVAAGVVGVAVLGIAGFFLIDGSAVSTPDGPPPVIAGLQEPLKVFPDETQSPADDQSAKLIYDRVDGTSEGGPDRLVRPESPEPASLPPAPAGTSNGAELVPGAPKRVRTLVVRPDGTIISNDDAAPASTPSGPSVSDSPKVVRTTPIVSGAAPEPAAPVTSGPVAVQTQPVQVSPESNPTTPAIVNGSQPTPAAPSEPVVSQPVAPVPSVLPRSKPNAPVRVAQAPTQAATPVPAANNDGPLNLAQPATAPVRTAPATTVSTNTASGSIAPGTYIVQVTSQRSAAAASDAYSGLQRRFPSILGSRDAVIVSADLGDRGVFYRARIPTGSRDDAVRLCEQLQGAGGDCFVRRAP